MVQYIYKCTPNEKKGILGMNSMILTECNPYIRYVNNYKANCSYVQKERIIYDYEFMFVSEGSVDIVYSGQLYHLKKSDIFFFHPFEKNYMIVKKENNFQTYCIHFDWIPPEGKYDFSADEFYRFSFISDDHYEKMNLLLHRPVPFPTDFSVPIYLSQVPYEIFYPLFSSCFRYFHIKDIAGRLLLRSSFLELLALLMSQCSEIATKQSVHPKIKKAINYIQNNYSKSISVESLSKRYELSPKYFGTIFKESTGRSFSDYLLQQRILAAKDLLINTNLNIEEIAIAVGFQNGFYFSKCFKQVEGLSPSVFRSNLLV